MVEIRVVDDEDRFDATLGLAGGIVDLTCLYLSLRLILVLDELASRLIDGCSVSVDVSCTGVVAFRAARAAEFVDDVVVIRLRFVNMLVFLSIGVTRILISLVLKRKKSAVGPRNCSSRFGFI